MTSKVAVVSPSNRRGVDVEYLFLQVFVDRAIVTDAQNCGNLLAGVGPFAIERRLVAATDGVTTVRIFMANTGQLAVAKVATPHANVRYDGEARIDGVPGTAAAIPLAFRDTAGSTCGALLPSGRARDMIEGVEVTLIDNGMPCVVLRASDVGATGYETRDELDAADVVKQRIEAIRLIAGPLMNLGDVTALSVPKMMLIAPPRYGGAVTVRSLIPHRAHASIGVFGAVSVATACLIDGAITAAVATVIDGDIKYLSVEHPTGETTCIMTLTADGSVDEVAVLRTARKLMDGKIYA